MHLARTDVEVDPLERPDSGECLRRATHLEQGSPMVDFDHDGNITGARTQVITKFSAFPRNASVYAATGTPI
jgi:hypothetical protein